MGEKTNKGPGLKSKCFKSKGHSLNHTLSGLILIDKSLEEANVAFLCQIITQRVENKIKQTIFQHSFKAEKVKGNMF